ncbi:metal-dependent hydrolase [Schumannella sp. 10F1B-5-1]|uniref:metal-dependent hydrolase n=1 Tax=Schumannella sp. 10F1B-5-1 TaxID=2590780 RepID=UPI0011317619|nr:metal-dependent hydrolase [Schumannella sp. 10F1B-5-1]TPW72965.1 metal-dependent hydrolase [Schumannella sp. 10F1B-5-1]
MTLPRTDTLVTYAAGSIEETAAVLHMQPLGDRLAVLVDRTPVHPVDAGWPDQGPDSAMLVANGEAIEIVDAVVGATDGETLFAGTDVPVRKGTEGWAFVVVHLVAADAAVAEGDTVMLAVEADQRQALSVGHTACHLASLALNRALAGAWRKEGRTDALGAPDFDGTAIETSTITPNGSVDEFRVGKSVRKAGFDPAALDDLAALGHEVDRILAGWTTTGAVVRIDADGEGLTDRRWWVADLPEGAARIPCGGTHVRSLSELGAVTVTLTRRELEGAVGVTMTTRASG